MSRFTAVTSQTTAGKWLSAEHFALVSALSQLSILPNLPHPLRDNKTVSLVASEGAAADGD